MAAKSARLSAAVEDDEFERAVIGIVERAYLVADMMIAESEDFNTLAAKYRANIE
jgi:hypothetical protein